MESIKHRTVNVNGISMHIAEKGDGPVVLLLHGFPELWYTWRHQILALSSHGYRAVAPDLRGYGDSEAPPAIASYSVLHIVGDLVALIDSIGVDKVFVVAHDWGAIIAWYLCLFRPDRIRAFVCLSVPWRPRNPNAKPLEIFRRFFGDDYYICRFQKPGEIEEEIAEAGVRKILQRMLTIQRPGAPILPKGALKIDRPVTMPSWLSEEDLDYYAAKFEKAGFTGGLNYYRALDLNWEVTAAWTNAQVKVPVKFIAGELDSVYTTPGIKEYIHDGEFKKDVPLLEEVVIMENVGHFCNEEKADEINTHILDFISKF